MSSIQVIAADAQSIAAVVALLKAQLEEHDIFPPEPALRDVAQRVVSDARHGFILLARDQAEAIGLAYAAAHLSAEHGGVVGWLEELYVAPAWRGRGVGSSLLTEVLHRAQQLQWRAVELEVVAGHERAVPLYRRHGFEPANRARFTHLFAES